MMKNKNRWSLKELLQLKRAEEPKELFWEKFDEALYLRLSQEPAIKVYSLKEIIARLWKQYLPISATCTLTIVLSLSFLSKNIMPRFVAFQPIKSVEACYQSRLQANDIASIISPQNVIKKKMIASATPKCFSF